MCETRQHSSIGEGLLSLDGTWCEDSGLEEVPSGWFVKSGLIQGYLPGVISRIPGCQTTPERAVGLSGPPLGRTGAVPKTGAVPGRSVAGNPFGRVWSAGSERPAEPGDPLPVLRLRFFFFLQSWGLNSGLTP
jgi:hypothetical protein